MLDSASAKRSAAVQVILWESHVVKGWSQKEHLLKPQQYFAARQIALNGPRKKNWQIITSFCFSNS